MVYRFKCRTCDQWHEGLPDITYGEPHYAWEVPEAERSSRVRLGSDLCSIDAKHFFIRAQLALPIVGSDEQMCWGVWTTLSKENFTRYAKHFDEDMSDWPPMFGWLSNRLPGYPDTLALKLSVQPSAKGIRPALLLEPTDHPLAQDQRHGIAMERVLTAVEPFLHPASTVQ